MHWVSLHSTWLSMSSKCGAQGWRQPLQTLLNSCMKLSYDRHWMQDTWNLVSLLLLWHVLTLSVVAVFRQCCADCQNISPFIISFCQGNPWAVTSLIRSRAQVAKVRGHSKGRVCIPFHPLKMPKELCGLSPCVGLCSYVLTSAEAHHVKAGRHRQQNELETPPIHHHQY